MSELTFNIADYRPLVRVPTRERGGNEPARTGFVVFSSQTEPYEYEARRLDSRPVVVDIRSVREDHRSCRGKVLRFRNPASHRVFMMPAHHVAASTDDDPGPMVA
jgi:hypothetical protein